MRAQTRKQRKWDDELERGQQPDRIAKACGVPPEGESEQPCGREDQCRLPKMVEKRSGPLGLPEFTESHDFLSLFASLESLRRSRSASLTSSSESFPDSIRWGITGWLRPPNIASMSSMRRRCADSREMPGANIRKLPTFRKRLTTCFASSLLTVSLTEM